MDGQAAYLSEVINNILAGAGSLLPEIMLVIFFLLLITLDLFKSLELKRLLPWLALTGLFAALIIQVIGGYTSGGIQFLDLLRSDGLARLTGILFSLTGAGICQTKQPEQPMVPTSDILSHEDLT